MTNILLKKAVQNLELTNMELSKSGDVHLTFKNPGHEYFYIGERFKATVEADEKLINAVSYFLERNAKLISPKMELREAEKEEAPKKKKR